MKDAGGDISRRVRRFPLILLAPLFVFLTLGSWALSSPVGASPDDDFHLVSIWCADAPNDFCGPVTEAGEIEAPSALLNSAACYAYEPETSAECQAQRTDNLDLSETELSIRANTVGGYPPIYYAAMNTFAGDNVEASVLVMRMINVLIFTALSAVIFVLLPVARRATLVWSWVITMVPVGMFMITSNNPSSWAIMGVGFAWIALLGFFETVGWRKAVLGGIYALTAFMAAGARGDASMYIVLATVAVVILTFRRQLRYGVELLLPLAVTAMCFLMFRFSRPVESVTKGITGGGDGGGGTPPAPTDLVGTFFWNLMQTPKLWSGVFGDGWGLGWLDTAMPPVVWLAGLAAFITAGFVAARSLNRRKLFVLICGVLVLWLFPSSILLGAGESVGDNLQPRYILPLVVLFAGLMLLSVLGRSIRFTRLQVVLVAVALTVANSIALHLNLQRYVHGFDDLGWNVNDPIEWWWSIPISPMAVWIVGTVAFGGLLAVTLRRVIVASDTALAFTDVRDPSDNSGAASPQVTRRTN